MCRGTQSTPVCLKKHIYKKPLALLQPDKEPHGTYLPPSLPTATFPLYSPQELNSSVLVQSPPPLLVISGFPSQIPRLGALVRSLHIFAAPPASNPSSQRRRRPFFTSSCRDSRRDSRELSWVIGGRKGAMIPAVKLNPAIVAFSGTNLRSKSALVPSVSSLKPSKFAACSLRPLYLAPLDGPRITELKPRKQLLEFQCAASAADDKESKTEVVPVRSEAAQKLKISIYFATWWALNVIFNIYNKKVLNAFPYPWLTSTLSLACGSAMMLFSWATRLVEAPKTDLDFWKVLFPVAVAHTIGHVAATVSMSKVAVSFTHIIKSAEPAFSVLVSRFILGESFPMPVYLSLLPIIGGCGLAAATELNFNMVGFMGAMISNLAFVFRNIFSKRGMKGKSVSGMNYYACLSIMSLVILTPFAIAMEGPQMWAAGWQKALAEVGPNVLWWIAAQSVFYHLYNQVSYMSLDEISPLTFSIGNTMKRISVIVSSIIIFHTPVRPVNALGAAIAIFGTFLYSQAKQ